MITVTNFANTIQVSDDQTGIDVAMEKMLTTVGTNGDLVVITWNNVNSCSYLYSLFAAPSGGSALIVATAIAQFLN